VRRPAQTFRLRAGRPGVENEPVSRLRWILVGGFFAFLVAVAVLTSVLFVWPSEDTPKHASAVVVLSGNFARLDRALPLMDQGVAKTLVISDGLDPNWHEANLLCSHRRKVPYRVICFHPEPFSTRGEAESITRLAAKNAWKSIVVVTSSYHVTRARMLFERCYHGKLSMVGSSTRTSTLPHYVASEWVKLLYALTLKRGC
jgi:uncharacterized SAM-binding protein YcdF (DUF218 family)